MICESGWGWHAGRIGNTTADDSNVSVLYSGNWREDHALLESDYGAGGVGSWVLLSPNRPASPLLDYESGRYKVNRGGDKWLRAEELVHHSGKELAAAREAKKMEAVEASQAACDAELDTGGFDVGRRVFAKGHGGDGGMGWFVAKVIGHRERFPPCAFAPKPAPRTAS